jgi:phospholipid-binding lipoprotein MlaA
MKNILFMFVLVFIFTNNIYANNSTQINVTNEVDEFNDFSEFNEFDDTTDKSDPLESYNRTMASFNDTVYVYVFNPISVTYASFVYKDIRKGISNFFKNLLYPVRLGNNLLQGKLSNSYDETLRFVINSTFGLLGIFDVAKHQFDIKEHNEDFGQTLGFWGVPSGPHIVLPFLGPSNLRDTFALPIDYYVNPTVQGSLEYKIPKNFSQGSFLYTFNYINKNSLNLGVYENLKKDSLDFYTFTKNFYELKRENDIKE